MNESFFIPVYFTIAGFKTLIPGVNYVLTPILLLMPTGTAAACMNFRMSRRLSMDITPESTVGLLGARGSSGSRYSEHGAQLLAYKP